MTKEKSIPVETSAPADDSASAEIAADKMADKEEKVEEKKKKKSYQKGAALKKKKKVALTFDQGKAYSITEAIKLAKENSREKFDPSIDIHFNLGIDASKGDQQVRSTVVLPHGIGKTIRIAAFVEPSKEAEAQKAGADFIGNDEFIDKIKKTEKTEFDLAIAEPSTMKKLGMIAKILGTRGLMPSPKNETVTMDPIKAIAEFKKGKLSFKNDDTGNVHVTIGRKSFDNEKLIENFRALLEIVKKSKPASSKGLFIKNIVVCSSMGPGVKVNIE